MLNDEERTELEDLRRQLAAVSQYLKPDQTVLELIESLRNDVSAALTVLIKRTRSCDAYKEALENVLHGKPLGDSIKVTTSPTHLATEPPSPVSLAYARLAAEGLP